MQSSTMVIADVAVEGLESEFPAPQADAVESACFHCGTPLGKTAFTHQDKSFCCNGCLSVYELLTANGLDDFYRFGKAAGVRAKSAPEDEDSVISMIRR